MRVQDWLAVARRSLMDRIVTIVSLTRVLVLCVVGVWLVCISAVPTNVRESTTPDSKTKSRLTQAVVFSQRHFLCGALLWNCSSAELEGLFTHVQRECSAEAFMRSILCHKGTSRLSQVLAYDFLTRCSFSPLEHSFVQ